MFSRNYEPVTENNPHILFKAGLRGNYLLFLHCVTTQNKTLIDDKREWQVSQLSVLLVLSKLLLQMISAQHHSSFLA